MNRSLAALISVAVCAAGLSGCAPAVPVAPSTPCAPGAVAVGEGADALQAALDAAVPGAVLQLEPSVYHGRFRATAVATADAPIVLCGTAGTVLDGGDVAGGYALQLEGAAYWDVRDLAVRGGQKGVVLDATTHSSLSGLTISDVGQEGLHLRSGSSDNTVRSVTVERTGLTDPEFGEGVYVGFRGVELVPLHRVRSRPQRSELVLRSHRARHHRGGARRQGGHDRGMVRDSSLSTSSAAVVDSAVDLKGADWRIEGNTIEVEWMP